MENYGRVFGGNDKGDFSIYSHVYTESVSAVQYSFYQEEIELAKRSVSTSLGTPRKPSIHALTS